MTRHARTGYRRCGASPPQLSSGPLGGGNRLSQTNCQTGMSPKIRRSIFKFGGVMLMALGILHLAVTPFISHLIIDNVTEAVAVWLTPPMLLNHVVVGILLLPLGFITFYAAPSAVAGEKWAVIITRASAITVAALPASCYSSF